MKNSVTDDDFCPDLEVKLIHDGLAYVYYKGTGYGDAPARLHITPDMIGTEGFKKLVNRIAQALESRKHGLELPTNNENDNGR